jgi:hypothetical protein
MATSTILQLPVNIGLTGFEWLEIATTVNNPSQRATSGQIARLASSVVPTGPTGVAADAPAGTQNNYTINGEFTVATGFAELTPAGACNITGLQAGSDGQIIIITNLSTFALTLNALNSGSLSANQFRMFGDLVLSQNNGHAFKYSATIGKWVGM